MSYCSAVECNMCLHHLLLLFNVCFSTKSFLFKCGYNYNIQRYVPSVSIDNLNEYNIPFVQL